MKQEDKSKKLIQKSQPIDSTITKQELSIVYNINDHTFIISLKDILLEDILWRREHPQIPALICLQQDNICDCNYNCMQKLAIRCFKIFKAYPTLQQIFVVFKRDKKPLIRKVEQYLYKAYDLQRLKNPPTIKDKIPRIFVLHITNNFDLRLFRANYDALCLFLRNSKQIILDKQLLI